MIVRKEQKLPICNRKEIPYSKAVKYNLSIVYDVRKPPKRKKFFRMTSKSGVYNAICNVQKESKLSFLWKKIVWNIKNRILK